MLSKETSEKSAWTNTRVVVCRWWMLVELVSPSVVARSSGTRPAPSPALSLARAATIGRATIPRRRSGAGPGGRTGGYLRVGPRSTGSNALRSPVSIHLIARRPAPRHRAPSRRSIMRWPYDPSPVFNKTRLPATSRRNSRAAEWTAVRAVGLASGLDASRCGRRRTADTPRPDSFVPLEGGRSRRSNFLAALNVLRAASPAERTRPARFSPARDQIKFSRKHYRSNWPDVRVDSQQSAMAMDM